MVSKFEKRHNNYSGMIVPSITNPPINSFQELGWEKLGGAYYPTSEGKKILQKYCDLFDIKYVLD